MATLLDPSVSRLEVAQHLDACASCAALFAFARNHRDLDALAAWRCQLAAHVEADRERNDFERSVVRRIATAATRGASLIEVLVALGIVAILAATALNCGLRTVAYVCAVLST